MAGTSRFPDHFLTSADSPVLPVDEVNVGPWRATKSLGRLQNGNETRSVEPKVMDLLFVLASRPNEVFSRESLCKALWPDTTVGEDALPRCIFKLRRALAGSSDRSFVVETIPKRGYRLVLIEEAPAPARAHHLAVGPGGMRWLGYAGLGGVVAVAAGLIVMSFSGATRTGNVQDINVALARADDSYFQYRQADNQAAILLYRRAIEADSRSAQALAGLSSALVQRALRWPGGLDVAPARGSVLRAALASGQLQRPAAAADIRLGLALAREAVSLDRRNPDSLRALGLALSAAGQIAEAERTYDRALRLRPDHWGVLINRADLYDLGGDANRSLALLERAYESMESDYPNQPAKIRPWQAKLGVEIARRYREKGQVQQAAQWMRRTGRDDPGYASAAALTLAGNGGAESLTQRPGSSPPQT